MSSFSSVLTFQCFRFNNVSGEIRFPKWIVCHDTEGVNRGWRKGTNFKHSRIGRKDIGVNEWLFGISCWIRSCWFESYSKRLYKSTIESWDPFQSDGMMGNVDDPKCKWRIWFEWMAKIDGSSIESKYVPCYTLVQSIVGRGNFVN